MCYNVLCDKYATRQMYGYCPSWALSWDYRKKVRKAMNIYGKNAQKIHNLFYIYAQIKC